MATPLRSQYLRIKKQFPDVIVLFRLGDFYETFDDDAKIVAEVCNIVLTGRDMGTGERVPLAGVPHHAVETYLARLVSAGHKVAIVEQMSEPVNGLMNREVARVVTPGTVVEPALLQDKANNFLAAVCIDDGLAAIAYADITTGEFAATELEPGEVRNELDRLHPAEVLLMEPGDRPGTRHMPGERLRYPTTTVPLIDAELARDTLLEQFQAASLEGFGLGGLRLAPRPAAAIIRYLRENQKGALAQLTGLRVYSGDQFMVLDPPTRKNLELLSGTRSGTVRGSLLGVLDETRTAMGGRLLRQRLSLPLRDLAGLNARLDRVDLFFEDTPRREKVRARLKSISDLERLANRVVQGIATPRDLRAICASLDQIPALGAELEGQSLISEIDPCDEVSRLIAQALVDDPPATLTNGGVIASGYSAELDSVKQASSNAKDWVAALERKERERTGIKSLKVGYNRVFGYYLEITTPNLPQAPSDYIRKQTLANAERFITPDLKEYESLILNAEERITELETSLFRDLCAQVAAHSARLVAAARAIAEIDVYAALAEVALRYRYVRPDLDSSDVIDIKAGRHPVVELALKDEPFVPNDCFLSSRELVHIITGPNMSGKSTFLRQVALIVLMAQVGSFVPANHARIGVVDRIFTRIGAEDAISAGQSTFMVEMVETANILNHCTERSLIVLDEIGRGTSTYDGIAIARAVVEYIHNHPRAGARTLFATHYHELTQLEEYLPKIKNYNVAVVEQGDRVVFLHKIAPGGADKSYGIHVAQLAGVPRPIVSRAEEILVELERGASNGDRLQPIQLALFQPDDWLRSELERLDVMALSPIEALNKLFQLQQKAKSK